MMANTPILPKPESTPEKNYEANTAAATATDAATATAALPAPYSYLSPERSKNEMLSVTGEDLKSLPPPPKGISSAAKPYYYALEKLKLKRGKGHEKLNQLRQKTEEAKKQYELLRDQLAKQESEMAQLETDINASSDAFFESRLGHDDRWNAMYKKLRDYKDEHGDLLVEKDDNPDLNKLKFWIKKQREAKNKGFLKPFREAALDRLGFPWKSYVVDMKWESNYDSTIKYRAAHGKFPTCKDPLGSWLVRQRKEYYNHKNGKECKLSPEKISKLDQLGLEDEPGKVDTWKERFDELVQYKEEHGCFPPIQNTKNRTQLGNWISYQRSQYKCLKEGNKSMLTEERVKMLCGIGFPWSLRNTLDNPMKTWQERYEELVAFYNEHGHCRVTKGEEGNRPLAEWVKRQRKNYWAMKDGKVINGPMTQERVAELEALGFSWQVRSRRSGPDKKQKTST